MTKPASAAARPLSLLAAALLAAAAPILAVSLLAVCGAAAGAPADPRASAADPAGSAPLPDRLFARLLEERSAGHERAVLELAYEIVDHHPEFAQADHALLEAVLAARRLGDVALARQLAGELRSRFPASKILAQIPKLPGEPNASEPDTLSLRLIREAESRYRSARADSTPGGAAIGPDAASGRPRAQLEAEAAPPAAEPAVIGLIYAAGAPGAPDQAMGARLAIAEAGRLGWRQCRLEPAETGADAGRSALAVRRFAERGAIAVVCDLGASAALATAVAADAWGMPLVVLSPDAADLRGFSRWVVPVELIAPREQQLLARLAVTDLDRRRAAVLYPDSEAGARACAEFGRTLLAAGGRLVAAAPCRPDAADAEAALRGLAGPRPELIYLPFPASTLPRLTAALREAPTGALALGRASWCDAPAAAFAAPALQGAVFPSDLAIWPAEWSEAFARESTAAGLVAGDEAAGGGANGVGERAAWRAYAGTRLVIAALADCGGQPRREQLTAALDSAWRRLREAPVTAAEASAGALRVDQGKVTAFAPPAPAPATAAGTPAGGRPR